MSKAIKYIFLLIPMVIGTLGFGQSLTINGQILSDDDQFLDQATVQILTTTHNMYTDKEGRFEVELESDEIRDLTFRISYTGCMRMDTTIRKDQLQQPLVFRLTCSSQLEEVVIRSFYPGKRNTSTVVTVEKFRNQPVLFGEPDVYKTLQAIPGINFGTEGSADLVVWGGGVGENLYVLDNIPLYAGSHLFGLMTPINSDLLDEVHVYRVKQWRVFPRLL